MRRSTSLTVFLALVATDAAASSSPWHMAEGVRMRLVTTGLPAADGTLRGALQIDLKPGWKTYWRDPGSSGVPPSIDLSRSAGAALLDVGYPAPMRFDDESGPWVGYKHSVAFPLSFRVTSAGEPVQIDADVFIGICQDICIPVQASFAVDVAGDPGNAEDAAVVDAALAALPASAEPGFGIKPRSADETGMTVEAAFSGDPDSVELFVAGADGYAFGAPTKAVEGRSAVFTLPILERPEAKPAGDGLPYTLVTQSGAVQGRLPYP